MITLRRSLATMLSLTLLVGSAPGAWAADAPAAPPPPPAEPQATASKTIATASLSLIRL